MLLLLRVLSGVRTEDSCWWQHYLDTSSWLQTQSKVIASIWQQMALGGHNSTKHYYLPASLPGLLLGYITPAVCRHHLLSHWLSSLLSPLWLVSLSPLVAAVAGERAEQAAPAGHGDSRHDSRFEGNVPVSSFPVRCLYEQNCVARAQVY